MVLNSQFFQFWAFCVVSHSGHLFPEKKMLLPGKVPALSRSSTVLAWKAWILRFAFVGALAMSLLNIWERLLALLRNCLQWVLGLQTENILS